MQSKFYISIKKSNYQDHFPVVLLILTTFLLCIGTFLSVAAAIPPDAIDVRNFPIQNISGRSQILPLIGEDLDGSIVNFIIKSLPPPSAGVLYLNGVAVPNNKTLTPLEAQELQFSVNSSFTGDATFTYTVTDNQGLTDASPATFTIPVVSISQNLVCTGGMLGSNVLGAAGTFSTPFIVPSAGSNCINDGSSISSPLNNRGKAHPELTSYTYASKSGDLGPEGTYSFLKIIGTMSSFNCIKGDWVAKDHTGDGGYFMVVNGSPNQASFGKTFYQAIAQPVCPYTLYEFSAYVINVLPGNSPSAGAGSEPNISFYINNTWVSQSGPIAYSTAATGWEPQWVKVGGLWYSGPNTSVDLRIDNATFVASGNDLGLDDISMAICGPEITYPDMDLSPKFCGPGILHLNAMVKSSINTYSSYIFERSINGGSTWQSISAAKIGSPVYDAVSNTYSYTAVYGDIPVDVSMNGYIYRLKVATNSANLAGTTCNISADKVITVSAYTKPNAGTDITGCNPSTTAQLVAALSGETWSVVSGNPASATINNSGSVSGMTVNGIYKFQLTNSAGCIDTIAVTRDQVRSAGADVILCYGTSSYKLDDATAGYSWEIKTGNPASAVIDPVTGAVSGMTIAGAYHFILRSAYGSCTDEVIITVLPAISIASTSVTNVLCHGAATGSVVITPGGGVGPYTITPAQSGLSAGNYNFTVTDAKNCTLVVPITITEPLALSVASPVVTNVSCHGTSTGSVIITPGGGAGPYTITPAQIGLAAGDYIFTVKDANNCTLTVPVTITEPSALSVAPLVVTNVLCHGALTGSVVITPNGGTGPYTITPAQTNLGAGSYIFTVKDANDCTLAVPVTITEPSAINVAPPVISNVLCHGELTGSVEITPNGGVGPYIITPSQTNLAAGNYNFTVRDANNCQIIVPVTILEPPALSIAPPLITNVSCSGASSGSVLITPNGGVGPYTITPLQIGLAVGSYTFTVKDANNCAVTVPITIIAEENTPPVFVGTLPADKTVQCDMIPVAETITATDDHGTPTVTFSEVRNNGSCPYNYSLVRTWTARDDCGLSVTYTQTIVVEDTTPPEFNEFDKDFCVENIIDATFTGITNDQPDWYLLKAGSADLDISGISDNCTPNANLTLHWQIDFADGTSLTGNGQPSLYAADIRFNGAMNGNVTHHITYRLVDQCGNETVKTCTIIIHPRPEIIT